MQPGREVELVVISDVHLGTYGSHARELNRYLRSIRPKTIVLNGDIIDIWQFRKSYWPESHWETVQLLLEYVQQGVRVFYLTGNHDDMLRKISDFRIRNFQLLDKLVLHMDGKRAWLFHGDIFDLSVKYTPWLAKLGGKSYDYLILLNRFINHILIRMGRERVSLSKRIKNSVKKAVRFIQDFEEMAIEHAQAQEYDYVICGHIHQPSIRQIDTGKHTLTYLNSGDWIENLTALEYHNGSWQMFRYFDHFDAMPTVTDEKKVDVVALLSQEFPAYEAVL